MSEETNGTKPRRTRGPKKRKLGALATAQKEIAE